jgi:sugar/nucleoside kinase (ribokinase family)
MSLLVTGSIGIDTVITPFGVSENCLGGSAVYFSIAASFFTPVRLVGTVGADCPFNLHKIFEGRNVDLRGLEVRQLSKTFRWKGSYHNTMNEAITEYLELNVLAEEPPRVPDEFKDSKFVFLANTAPALQMELLKQVDSPTFVAADTMNCWIDSRSDDLKALLKKIDCLVINAEEARALAGQDNLAKAAEQILQAGPRVLVIKKGESGALLCAKDGSRFALPAYLTTEVKDPTGAGDSFAGAMMGRLAEVGKSDFATLKEAIGYGTVAASFTISDFSLEGWMSISRSDIDARLTKLKELTRF